MNYKPLTKSEKVVIKALNEGLTQSKAFMVGYPMAKRWKSDTVAAKVKKFFTSARFKMLRAELNASGTVESKALKVTTPANIENYQGFGGPTKYKPEFIDIMFDHFNVEPFTLVEHKDNAGKVLRTEKIINALPSKASLAIKLGVCRDTLNEWATKVDDDGCLVHADFSAAYKQCAQYQEHILNTNALLGHYNPMYAKFVAMNYCGLQEGRNITIAGDPDKPIKTININMSEQLAAQLYKDEMERKD